LYTCTLWWAKKQHLSIFRELCTIVHCHACPMGCRNMLGRHRRFLCNMTYNVDVHLYLNTSILVPAIFALDSPRALIDRSLQVYLYYNIWIMFKIYNIYYYYYNSPNDHYCISCRSHTCISQWRIYIYIYYASMPEIEVYTRRYVYYYAQYVIL